MDKFLMTDHRRKMTPQMFEAIMFLRYNKRFWNGALVSEAINMNKSDRSASRFKARLLQNELAGMHE